MSKPPTNRELARIETIRRIKELALAQLAAGPASDLSLRAIARELDLVSSAIYRYFSSRDALLTALIIDAYDDLADQLEKEVDSPGEPRVRWLNAARVFRSWAVAAPHRFALIYGSAIPGYQAPQDTIVPAGRVVAALIRPIVDSADRQAPAPAAGVTSIELADQVQHIAAVLGVDKTPGIILPLIAAFSRLIGLLTLELNGHFVGGFEPADDLFGTLMESEADALGL